MPYYCKISIKEGLDIETEKPHLERFIEKTFSKKCRLCCQLFIIAKNFKNLVQMKDKMVLRA